MNLTSILPQNALSSRAPVSCPVHCSQCSNIKILDTVPKASLKRLPPLTAADRNSRQFRILSSTRPTVFPGHAIHRPSPQLSNSEAILQPPLDLLPRISAHPSLANIQIRNGPRDTYNPSQRVRKRRHGFLSRLRTKKGRKTLKRRQLKGRWALSH